MNTKQVLLFLIVISHFSIANAGENETLAYFNTIKDEPTLLRNFLFRFPKGAICTIIWMVPSMRKITLSGQPMMASAST